MERPRGGCDLTAFPSSLFPTHYSTGPAADHRLTPGTWSLLGPVQRQENPADEARSTARPLDEGQQPRWVSQRRHGVEWEPVEPVALPFLPLSEVCTIPDFEDERIEEMMGPGKREAYHAKSYKFIEQMSNFFMDHPRDAFLSMGKLLEPYFNFSNTTPKAGEQVTAGRMLSYRKEKKREKIAHLLGDALWEVPHHVLADCLREELRERRARERFDAACTGGCLHYHPPLGARTHGLLIYPSGSCMDTLSFQTIAQKCEGKACRSSCIKTLKPSVKFHLAGGIRQISTSSIRQEVFVGVRSDYFCGLWKTGGEHPLRPQCVEVVQLEEPATCLTVSPHIPGELLVASESGSVYLWVAQKSSLQCVRRETRNLHFDAESRWRWCHFTAHPRVITYADRTGVDATDARIGRAGNTSLFRIGEAAGCQQGERVVLSQHLDPVNPFHFLVTTQYSAYLMDERLPILPMLRWNHGLTYPPLFVHATHGPGGGISSSAASGGQRQHLLLGTQRKHELLMLSYTGGGQEPCCTTSLPRKLACASEWLGHVRPLLPHQKHLLRRRLESAGAGVTAIPHQGSCGRLTVLQLSVAGDIFYQTLRPGAPGTANAVDCATEPPSATHDAAPPDPAMLAAPRRVIPPPSGGTKALDSRGDGSGSAVADSETGGGGGEVASNGSADLLRSEVKRCQRWASSFLLLQRRAAGKLPPYRARRQQGRLFRHLHRRMPEKPSDFSSIVVGLVRAKLRAGVATGAEVAVTAGRGSTEEERSEEVQAQPSLQLLLPVLSLTQEEEPVLFPKPVADAEAKDELSSRLTAAWHGEWHEWWEEKLGIASKRRARDARQRRREKKLRGRRHRRLQGSYSSTASEWATEFSETMSCSGKSFTSVDLFSQSSHPDEVELDLDILQGHYTDDTRASAAMGIDSSQHSLFEDDAHVAASSSRPSLLGASSQNLPSSILKKNPSKTTQQSLAETAVQDKVELWTNTFFGESLSQMSQSSTPFFSRARRPAQASDLQRQSPKPLSPSLSSLQKEPSSSQHLGPAQGNGLQREEEPSSGVDGRSQEADAAVSRPASSMLLPFGFSSQPSGGSPMPWIVTSNSQGSSSTPLPQRPSSQSAASLLKKKKRFTMGF
ncbi:TATA box-binding protein-associated factor RNA polymerase I subunit C isoform X3 [Lethenteron reissneri]|uniref:TATA box-binding protein-associated factor RNA polymerase I subunit C isoform X3 n=1 Tax=Lethenteron reissneri TaxID=7753 RepID=UPI002AB7CF31|nr:TATA box-binding protein-associated factor RNA polymerase I subunit C isoform X3 [Lethenteron reissneri]